MTVESITRFLRDHMLYMDFLVLLFALLAFKAFDKKLRLVFIDLVVGIIVVMVSQYTASLGNNLYISYIYAPYEVIIMSAILWPVRTSRHLSIGLKTAIAACLLVNLLEGLLVPNGFTQYNSITYVLINSTLGAMAIHYMIRLRYNPSIENLAQNTMFWIAMGIAVKHIALFVVWAFFRLAQNNSMELLWQLSLIREVVIYLTLTLWITGFWKARTGLDRI